MYWRRILCTLYGAVDFFIVLSKGLHGWGGGGPSRAIKFLYAPALPPTEWALKPPSWSILGSKWHSPISSMPFHRAKKTLDFQGPTPSHLPS
jgi:hypothetical protein